MTLSISTQKLPTKLRPLLCLFLDLITESPVRRGDTLLPYEEVVTALERDTILMQTTIGIDAASAFTCGPFANSVAIVAQVEPRKYETGVQWLVDLLHNSEFTVDRIRVCASKITNAVAQAKRKGNAVVADLLKSMYYEERELKFGLVVMDVLFRYCFSPFSIRIQRARQLDVQPTQVANGPPRQTRH